MALVFPVVFDPSSPEIQPFVPLFSGQLWGRTSNEVSQELGNGPSAGSSTPIQIGSATDWEWVTSGISFNSFGIENGKLFAWGDASSYSLLGLGDNTDRDVPTQVGSDTDWEQVSNGSFFSLAIKGGKLYSWGWNGNYRTAQGTDSGYTATPTQVGSDTGWTHVSAGSSCAFAIRDGKLYSWGVNAYGQTGLGITAGDTSSPTQVGSDSDWEWVSATEAQNAGAGSYAVGIRDGKLYSWGLNTGYLLGLNDQTNRDVPTQVGSATGWEMVDTAIQHSVAIKSGELFSWGSNNLGRTGRSTTIGFTGTPTKIGSATDWEWCCAGNTRSFAIRSGALFGFGENYGASPQQIGSDTDWQMASAGTTTALFIKG